MSLKLRIAAKNSKKGKKMGNSTYRDMQKGGVQIMFRWDRGLKMVSYVFIDIDNNNKSHEKLIRETRYLNLQPCFGKIGKIAYTRVLCNSVFTTFHLISNISISEGRSTLEPSFAWHNVAIAVILHPL